MGTTTALARALALLLLALTVAAATSAGAQAATLGGTISAQDAGERPAALAGATITAAEAGSGTPVASATSDPLGGYLLTLPDGAYDVTVSASGREPLTRRGVAVSGAAQLDAILVPTGHGRIFGTIVGADGDPVPGVAVEFAYISGPQTVGAADGTFSLVVPQVTNETLRIAGGPAAESWTLLANVTLAAGDEREISARVPPMTTLTARVLGNDDAPLEGVDVQLPTLRVDTALGGGFTGTFTNDLREGVTDAAGEFSGQVLDHGVAYIADQVAAFPDSDTFYSPAGVQPQVDGPTLVTLRLTRFGSLDLHIRDADGNPTQGGTVGNGFGWVYGTDVSVRRSEGVHELTIRPKTLGNPAPWVFYGEPYAFVGAKEETLRLPQPTTTTIRVVDQNGDPVAGASVTPPLFHVAWGPSTMPGRLTVPLNRLRVTDADGVVEVGTFAGMAADPATPGVVVPPTGNGYEEQVEFTVADVGGTNTVVVQRDLVHLDGTVVDPDGDPIAGARIVFANGYETATLADGSFALDLPAGLTGFSLYAGDVRLDAGGYTVEEDATLTLRVPRRVQLTVEVTGDGDRPLAGANVNLVLLQASGLDIGSGIVATGRTSERNATTDGAGTAVFPVFVGSRRSLGSRGITVTGPAGSGYLTARPPLPTIDGDETVAVRLLRAGPALAFAPTPAPADASGDWWAVGRVTLAVTASDGDGVASLTCSVDGVARRFAQTRTATTIAGTFDVVGEGRHQVACGAADQLGDLSDGGRRVWIDRHRPAKPSIATDRPADSSNGWWRDAVTAATTDAGDPPLADGSAGSGVDPASVPAPVVHDGSGRFVVSATVADLAGNVSATRSATVKVDADAPTSTLTCPAAPVRAGAVAKARWLDADAHSGLAAAARGALPLDTATPGAHVAEHVATDRVGHQTTSTCSYTVV